MKDETRIFLGIFAATEVLPALYHLAMIAFTVLVFGQLWWVQSTVAGASPTPGAPPGVDTFTLAILVGATLFRAVSLVGHGVVAVAAASTAFAREPSPQRVQLVALGGSALTVLALFVALVTFDCLAVGLCLLPLAFGAIAAWAAIGEARAARDA